MTALKDVAEGVMGATAIAGCLVASPFIRGWYNEWGATASEVQRLLPGDELVPNPRSKYTRGITIDASPTDIWPWLVQIGQGRGGLYSYEWLENIARCDIHNTDRLLPEYQQLKVGDAIRLGPKGYPLFKVHEIQPNRVLVLVGADPNSEQIPDMSATLPESYNAGNWIFFLEPIGERTTRLIVRGWVGYEPKNFANVLTWNILVEPIGFVMIRKMMLGIKQRVEQATRRQQIPVVL